ncbi:hypothetical protein [Mycobacterium terramassiliense]|uniref:hypothetical protein n=1 Tax=Mycobacterium terramassiliense TaxID=1841859 RepID=UPI0012FFB7A7|nr:hypothetical protein [Mycobacterium terramassiliense]
MTSSAVTNVEIVATSRTSPSAFDFALGALLRDDSAAANPAVARLLGVSADQFEQRTGMAAHDFLLAATGRSDPARLGPPDVVNIYR